MHTITERIKEFNKDREAALQQRKYEAMSENVFRFFRGTCHIFYEDLSKEKLKIVSPPGWICGDLHLENFGSFKSDNRLVYFDINDFDESVLAPLHWELVRIVTSIFVALQSLKIERRKAEKLANLFLKTYCATLRNGKALYIERQTATGIVCDFLEQASLKKHRNVIEKHTIQIDGDLKIALRDLKYAKIEKPLRKELLVFMQNWLADHANGLSMYKPVDCAFRFAGTGSFGLKRYGFLLKRSDESESKYLLLDMKQVRTSATAAFVDIPQPAWRSEAHRITEIQKRMQNCPPALLSPAVFKDEHFIIKELQPQKDGLDFNLFCDRYHDMSDVIRTMAVLVASAQLRSAGRQGSAIADELISFGTDESWLQEVVNFALVYAGRVSDYYDEFVADISKQ
ncbi:MAG: DUF2252 family protein [Ferruginibacter sp.]